MALLATSADYTDRDFASLVARMRSLITSVFPDWTDAQTANFANLLVELYCFVGDVLGFYQDNQAGESRWTTATQRKNLIAMAKLIGYAPSGASAATVDVTFTLASPVPGGRTVVFNAPAVPTPTNPTIAKTINTEDQQEFQLLSPVTITAGNTTGTGSFENSKLQGPETFAATGIGNQTITLSATPYLDNSAIITAGNGTFTQVSSFLSSTASDKHFVVSVDANDKASIRFGNGTNGAVPVGTITVTYKTGGGLAGNIIAGSLTKLDGNFVDSAGDPVTVTITNANPATGGDDRDSNEVIRENAPLSLRTLTRTVSRDDYENNAVLISGVERAFMATKAEDGSIGDNAGYLYVVPAGIGFPSLALKNAVYTQVTKTFPNTITFSPEVTSPVYVDIGVKATIFLKPGFVAATVRANIISALRSFFALRNADGTKNTLIDFGFYLKAASGAPAGEIALSDVFNVVRDVAGVREIGDGINDFQLNAYRVISTTTSYTGGGFPATLVQAYAHTDVPVTIADFPRLKASAFGGSYADVDLTIDGVNYPAGP